MKSYKQELEEQIAQLRVDLDIVISQNKVLKEDLKDREERIEKLDINYNHLKENYDNLKQAHETIITSRDNLKDLLNYAVGLL